MSLIRILVHAFLVLALLAGGLAPGAVSAAGDRDEAPMSAPCHDLAGDAIEPAPVERAPADCCEDGGCACDCLHHTPIGFHPAAPSPRLALLGVNQRRQAAVLAMASAAPEIRPPIA